MCIKIPKPELAMRTTGIFSFNWNYLHEESDIPKLPLERVKVYCPLFQNTVQLKKWYWLKFFNPMSYELYYMNGRNSNIQKGCKFPEFLFLPSISL